MDQRISTVIQMLQGGGLSSYGHSSAKHDVHLHYQHSVCELAEAVNLSESHLRALFKAELGVSIARYIKQCKLEKAYILVCKTHLRIGEIAQQLCFNDESHFLRDFKRHYGVTPKQCRLRVTSLNHQIG